MNNPTYSLTDVEQRVLDIINELHAIQQYAFLHFIAQKLNRNETIVNSQLRIMESRGILYRHRPSRVVADCWDISGKDCFYKEKQ